MTSKSALALAKDIVDTATARGLHIATAESCTAGLIAACLTDIPGSSNVVEGGFVTYSNEAKTQLLGVPAAVIAAHGAVSHQVAGAMARGAMKAMAGRADIAVSVTGIAGPGGGTEDKPVGLVWFGLATSTGVRTEKRLFPKGSRDFIRQRSVETALTLIRQAL